MSPIREPYVSGAFYPGRKDELVSMLNNLTKVGMGQKVDGEIIGAIVPHAGYVYSGVTASFAYSSMEMVNRKILIIGPNHEGFPNYSAIYTKGGWRTPLGVARIDEDLSDDIARHVPTMKADEKAHSKEHSVEVQIPFIQYFTDNNFLFTPIILGDQYMEVVMKIADKLSRFEPLPLLIASSDLNHYEDLRTTELKDGKVMASILSLDVEKFYGTLRQYEVTACGFGAIAILMEVTRMMGGRMMLLNHSTSAEAYGDRSRVVGYASFLAVRPNR